MEDYFAIYCCCSREQAYKKSCEDRYIEEKLNFHVLTVEILNTVTEQKRDFNAVEKGYSTKDL